MQCLLVLLKRCQVNEKCRHCNCCTKSLLFPSLPRAELNASPLTLSHPQPPLNPPLPSPSLPSPPLLTHPFSPIPGTSLVSWAWVTQMTRSLLRWLRRWLVVPCRCCRAGGDTPWLLLLLERCMHGAEGSTVSASRGQAQTLKGSGLNPQGVRPKPSNSFPSPCWLKHTALYPLPPPLSPLAPPPNTVMLDACMLRLRIC